MNPTGLDELARELCDLLQRQIDVVVGRKFNDFKNHELAAYEKRKQRIATLRAELQKFVWPA